MKISIITPYKNAADFLPDCVHSLHVQPGDFEFVLVNDGSSDNGPDLVELYKEFDDRIIAIDNYDVPGVSGARNVGLDNATGERITFLDVDDLLVPEAYRHIQSASKLNADIIQFNHKRYYPTKDRIVQKYDNAPGEYNIHKRPKCWPMVWNKLFTREILEGVRFAPCLQYGEDEIFILKCLAKVNRIRCVEPCTVVHCYKNAESLTKIIDYKSAFGEIFALEELLIRSDDPEYKRALCEIIGDHWKSETYKKIFGIGKSFH